MPNRVRRGRYVSAVVCGNWRLANFGGQSLPQRMLKASNSLHNRPIGFEDQWGRMKPQLLSYGVPVRSLCRRWATAWLSCLYVAKLKTPLAMRQKFEIQVKRDRDVWM